jgi:hypothetical protein
MNNVSRKLGGTMIEYEDENPEIRAQYERECAQRRSSEHARCPGGLKGASPICIGESERGANPSE